MNYYTDITLFLLENGLTADEVEAVFKNIQELAQVTNTPLNELYRSFYLNLQESFNEESDLRR